MSPKVTHTQRYLKDDMLEGGINDNFYISGSESNTVYRVTKITTSSNAAMLQRELYSFNGRTRTDRKVAKSLESCLNDERAPSSFKRETTSLE